MTAPPSGLERLTATVAEVEDRIRAADPAERAAAQQRFLAAAARGARPRRRPALLWAPLGAVGAVAVAFLLWWMLPGQAGFYVGDGTPGSAGTLISAGEATTLPIRFVDGTAVELESGSRVRVEEVSDAGATLRLESGRASVHVVKRPTTRWLVEAGPFEVVVTGTRFEVAWDEEGERFDLALEEGSLKVRGPLLGDGLEVEQGASVHVSIPETKAVVSTAREAGADEAGPREEEPAEEPGTEPAAEPGEEDATETGTKPESGQRQRKVDADTWQQLAGEGEYAKSLEAAREVGFDRLCRTLPADELMRLADTARFARSSKEAVQALSSVRTRFAGQKVAADAAYTLGGMAFDIEGDFHRAAQWFSTYLKEQPSGALAREAWGRLMEARLRAGDRDEARAVARRYLVRYPDGPHKELARRLADE